MAQTFTYRWARPGLTVDTVVVTKPEQSGPPKVLLIQRKKPPFEGQWAIPGGFVDENEPLYMAAARELQEETSVASKDLELLQVGAYGDPGRDPRGWSVTVLYATLVPTANLGVQAAVRSHNSGLCEAVVCIACRAATQSGMDFMPFQQTDDAADARWYNVNDLPALAFDHKVLLRDAFRTLAKHSGSDAQAGNLAALLEEGASLLDTPWVPQEG